MNVKFCNTEKKYLEAVVELLRNDFLGQTRQNNGFSKYEEAFQEIFDDKNNEIVVGLIGDQVVYCAQVTYMPGLTYLGQTTN